MSGNFYGSPNMKPDLNESLMNQRVSRKYIFPQGTFTRKNNRNTLESRVWGNTPFFTNAKSASMLEKGWIRSKGLIKIGQKGLYVVKDGPEVEVEVVEVTNKRYPKKGNLYTFEYKSEFIEADDDDRFEEWDFYYPTKARSFVPRKRGGKRKTRRKA